MFLGSKMATNVLRLVATLVVLARIIEHFAPEVVAEHWLSLYSGGLGQVLVNILK